MTEPGTTGGGGGNNPGGVPQVVDETSVCEADGTAKGNYAVPPI